MTKQIKSRRKTYIGWIATLLGFGLTILLLWLIFSITPKDAWTLTKTTFSSEEKIMEHWPKVETIDKKVEKSIMSKPLGWVSKKLSEETAKEVLRGDLGAITKGARTYCIIILVIWLASLIIIWLILGYLLNWIIGSFVWKEPSLEEI